MSDATNNSLVIFEKAETLLAQANTIQELKEFKNLALTAADWAKRKGLGEEAVKHCKSYAMRAKLRMGQMLKATPRAKGTDKGGKPKKIDGSRALPSNAPPTLSELGISKREASEAQKLAELNESDKKLVEEVIQMNITETQARRKQKEKEIKKKVSLPNAKYRVVYADPPWSYGNTQPDYHTEQRDHYPVMTLKEICALDVKQICEDNSVLFLWVTSPILEESFQVIKSWGFKYKSSFIWDKVKHNMGHYNSVRHEFLLICVRGSCQPDVKKLYDSVQSIERTKHSEKPKKFYEIIETLYPHGKRIELFSRTKRKGWKAYGHEANLQR